MAEESFKERRGSVVELLRLLAIVAPAFVRAEIMLGIHVLKNDSSFHNYLGLSLSISAKRSEGSGNAILALRVPAEVPRSTERIGLLPMPSERHEEIVL